MNDIDDDTLKKMPVYKQICWRIMKMCKDEKLDAETIFMAIGFAQAYFVKNCIKEEFREEFVNNMIKSCLETVRNAVGEDGKTT